MSSQFPPLTSTESELLKYFPMIESWIHFYFIGNLLYSGLPVVTQSQICKVNQFSLLNLQMGKWRSSGQRQKLKFSPPKQLLTLKLKVTFFFFTLHCFQWEEWNWSSLFLFPFNFNNFFLLNYFHISSTCYGNLKFLFQYLNTFILHMKSIV